MANYRQLMGIIVAIGILAVIFVPFQRANAFVVTTTLPNASGNSVTQTAIGENFAVTITVPSNELISISSINTILDQGQTGVQQTRFSSSGARTDGSTSIVKDNTLTISPSPSTTGYGFGYGTISSGYSIPTTSYSFSYGYGYLGGNTLGYSYSAGGTNSVTGFRGPLTVTISGKLNTALMSAGSHTLDILINTGAGGNGQDRIAAPQLTFTVNANSQVTTTTVNSGTNVALPPITIPGTSQTITVTISNVQTGGTIVVEPKSAATLDAETPAIFASTGSSSGFTVGTTNSYTAGTVFEVDISSLTLGTGATIDVTIPYDPTLLPAGFNESNVKFFHWTGTTWEDKTLSVNTVANTVTGRLTSLSPIVAGFTPSSSTSSSSSSSGGRGGGSGGAIDLTPTYPDAYFAANPLAKVQLQSSSFVNANGLNVFGASSGQQVTISTSFKNYQQGDQNYAIIVQVIDSDGFTTDIGWSAGKLEGGASTQASRSWTTDEPGSYTVKLFVWNGVSQAPTPLSEVTTKNFVVT